MDYGYRGSGTWEGTKEQDGYRRIPITSAGEIKSGDYGRIWRDIVISSVKNKLKIKRMEIKGQKNKLKKRVLKKQW